MSWFLPLVIFLLPSYLIRFSVAGIPTTLLEVLIYLSVVGILVGQPLARLGESLKPVWRSYGWPILLLILSALIATAISPDKRVALGLLKAYIVDPILLFLVMILALDTPRQRKQAIYALLGSGFLVALTALGIENNEGRALGLYVADLNPSPNYAALYLAPVAALGLGLLTLRFEKEVGYRSLVAFPVAAMTAAILRTESRGALLAYSVAFGATVINVLFKKTALQAWQRLYGLTLGALLLGALVIGLYLSLPNFQPNASHRATTSNNLRYEIWRTTVVDIIPAKPFTGVGLGNYQTYFTAITQHRVNFPEYISPWARTPHNFFLNIWVNLGLLGLLAMVWLLVRFFIDLARQPSAWRFPLSLAMVALLVHGLVDAAYWKNDLAALFWVILAFGYLESHHEKL